MATVPSPRDWVATTDVPTAVMFNSDIRDATNFFVSPQRALCFHNGTNITCANQTWTLMTWNQEDADTEAIHSTSSNTSRLTAVTAGRYQVYLSCRWEWFVLESVNGARAIMVRKNSFGAIGTGSEVCSDRRRADEFIASTFGVAGQSCTGFVNLAAGDHVEAFAWADERSAANASKTSDIYSVIPSWNANTVRFGMVWIANI